MRRLYGIGLFMTMVVVLPLVEAGGKAQSPKEALQALQDLFIGGWKGSGTNVKTNDIWKESVDWSWRFKDEDAWLTVRFTGSKLYKSGEIRWLPDQRKYQLSLIDKKDKQAVFVGELKKGALQFERENPDTKDTEILKIANAAQGIRSVYTFSVRPEGRKLDFKTYQLAYTKEGEAFGTDSNKKPECVVTGGLGTMTVSYNGQTYYVCCSGCRDAFNENPAKIIAQYMERKKKGM
jgi:ribosomal protein L24E